MVSRLSMTEQRDGRFTRQRGGFRAKGGRERLVQRPQGLVAKSAYSPSPARELAVRAISSHPQPELSGTIFGAR